MKNKLSDFIGWAVPVLVIFAIAIGIGGCVNYRIDLYKRKYPGTTTLDYWLDLRK